MTDEIGSEFALAEITPRENAVLPADAIYVFSGRTAIEAVLKNEKCIKKALLPSYCCESMIEPFLKAGIEVSFYSVFFKGKFEICIPNLEGYDCLLWCNYFGFSIAMPDFSDFLGKGGILIEDVTHSLFSSVPSNLQSTYVIASLRKWGPMVCGGVCFGQKKDISAVPIKLPPLEYINLKKSAMAEKSEYLIGNNHISKELFLNDFCIANQWLANNYSDLAMDDFSKKQFFSIQPSYMYKSRRENAKVLYDGLNRNHLIQFLFPIDKMECPLFVPTVIDPQKREYVRRRLTENDIFCPVHWPKPKYDCESNLYDTELSLVCDQRYNERDMNRIIAVLNDVAEEI